MVYLMYPFAMLNSLQVPFAYFLNHNGVFEVVLLNDEVKQTSEVIADQNYAPGKQVLIRYGKFPNSTLLLDFGFTLPYNSFDQVQVQINIPQDDHLCLVKMELLHKYSIRGVRNSRSLGSLQHSFIIKEVRRDRKTGRHILQRLRAFARVLCADSIEELQDMEVEAAQTDGRLARNPLKNINMEIKSHQLLLSLITDLIQDYDDAIKTLKLVDDNCSSGKFAKRKIMAQDLLSGELRVLKSASAWLNNYCSTLSRQTTVTHEKVIL